MRRLAIATLFLALVALPVRSAVADQPPLNILVLYADDWRADTLGVAGNPIVKTPTSIASRPTGCASATTTSRHQSAA